MSEGNAPPDLYILLHPEIDIKVEKNGEAFLRIEGLLVIEGITFELNSEFLPINVDLNPPASAEAEANPRGEAAQPSKETTP